MCFNFLRRSKKKEDDSTYTLILMEVRENKILLIRKIKEISNISATEAIEKVNKVYNQKKGFAIIKTGINKESALELQKYFFSIGARVAILKDKS